MLFKVEVCYIIKGSIDNQLKSFISKLMKNWTESKIGKNVRNKKSFNDKIWCDRNDGKKVEWKSVEGVSRGICDVW